MTDPIQLVIFDCDGILVDSEWIGVRLDQVILREVGFSMPQHEVIERFVGRPAAALLDAIGEHLGHPVAPEDAQRYDDMYFAAIERELAPVDGIEQALAELTLPVCVPSSSEPVSLRRKLEITELLGRFDGHVFSAAEVRHGKPAPDLFLHAAARLGVAPDHGTTIFDDMRDLPALLAGRLATPCTTT